MRPLQVFLNPTAAQGRGEERFAEVEALLWKDGIPFDLHRVAPGELALSVVEVLAAGHRDLVAAGGDGTVNALVNVLMDLEPEKRAGIRLGALALGSSNDLHKPVPPDAWYARVAARMDPGASVKRAVYRLEHDHGTVHYLQNSSVGLVARGCRLFSHAWAPLRWLIRRNYQMGVGLLSLYNVLTHRPERVTLRLAGREESGLFSGVTVLKQGAVAGSMTFRTMRSHDDGLFDVVCLEPVGLSELPAVLEKLAAEGPSGDPRIHLFQANSLELRFDRPTLVEYDGETLETTVARYSIVPDALSLMGPGVPR